MAATGATPSESTDAYYNLTSLRLDREPLQLVEYTGGGGGVRKIH